MNLTDQIKQGQDSILIGDALSMAIMSMKICPMEGVVAPDSNELIISVGDSYAGLMSPKGKIYNYVYNISKPLCYSEDHYGEFHQEINIINNEPQMRAYIEWYDDGVNTIEELEPINLILHQGYNIIKTNYQNVELEMLYPRNNDFNKNFINTTFYNMNKKINNELSINDLYFKDAFTKMGDELNLEVDNLNVKCITSKNNKFSLDSDGNLIVNSITTNSDNISGSINQDEICNFIYPVGSIYMSVNNINPSTLFGGTWEQLKDRFLLGAGSTYGNGDIGGEASHLLTINEMPTHTHGVNFDQLWSFGGTTSLATTSGGPYGAAGYIHNTGGSQPHNNMPPYLVVNIWKRVS